MNSSEVIEPVGILHRFRQQILVGYRESASRFQVLRPRHSGLVLKAVKGGR